VLVGERTQGAEGLDELIVGDEQVVARRCPDREQPDPALGDSRRNCGHEAVEIVRQLSLEQDHAAVIEP
jgi:hypothetical protein